MMLIRSVLSVINVVKKPARILKIHTGFKQRIMKYVVANPHQNEAQGKRYVGLRGYF